MVRSTVTLRFTALPAHVRTARFVATAVARRAGLPESLLDEVRLAVSEACSLAVRAHQRHAPAVPVEVRLSDDGKTFCVEVQDAVPRTGPAVVQPSAGRPNVNAAAARAALGLDGVEGFTDVDDPATREQLGLAVIAGLVDDLRVEYGPAGAVISLRWPAVESVAE